MWSLLWMGEMKACSNGLGHMTKMAAMLIYGYMVKKKKKNLLSWNQKANDLETWYTASSITKFVQVMPLCWLWPIFTARSDLVPYAFVWEKIKTMGFSETIVVYDIKVGRCSQLGEYLKLYEYQRSRSFIDLRPNHSDSIFLNFFSSITAAFNISSALRWAIQDQWSSGFCLVWQAVVNLFDQKQMKSFLCRYTVHVLHIWVASWQNLFYTICEQQSHSSTCTSTPLLHLHLYCLLSRQYNTYRCCTQSFKIPVSFCTWAG